MLTRNFTIVLLIILSSGFVQAQFGGDPCTEGIILNATGGERCGSGNVTLNATYSGSESHQIRWYTTSSGGTHIATGNSYTVNVSSTTTYYAAVYFFAPHNCENTIFRSPATAVVNSLPTPPTIGYQSGCGSGQYSLSTSPGSGGNEVKWYTASSGGSAFHTGNSYTATFPVGVTTYYVSSRNTSTGCEGSRNPYTVDIDAALSSGSIGSNRTICEGASVGTLTSSSGASGGNGSYIYTWQYSSNGSSGWTDIGGTNSATYNPGGLSTTRWYRRKVSSTGCSEKYSNAVKVTVTPINLNPGQVTPSSTICYNASTTITQILTPTGGTGSYSREWQISTNGSSFTDMGQSDASINTGNLTSTRYYRLKITSGSCNIAYTPYSQVTVLSPLNAGSIGNTNTLGVCYNDIPGELTNTASASNGSGYTYQWEYSTTSASAGFSNAPGSSSNVNYIPSTAITTDTWYRRKVTSCNQTAHSNVVLVDALPALVPGTITGNQTICYNEVAATLQSSVDASGGLEGIDYTWQSGPSSTGPWTSIGSTNSSTYSPGNLTSSTYFRRFVSETICGDDASNVVFVEVQPAPTPGTISGNQLVSYQNTAATITNVSSPTGGSNTFTYQWQISEDGTVWDNIGGATNETFAPTNTDKTYYYKRLENESVCSYNLETSATKVEVPQILPYADITFLNPGDTVTLSTHETYDTYQWLRDGQVIATTAQVVATKLGRYELNVTRSASTASPKRTYIEDEVFNQTESFVAEYTARVSGLTTLNDIKSGVTGNVIKSVNYHDGLGRRKQSVTVGVSPTKKDLVQVVEYNSIGLQEKSHLPYISDTVSSGTYKTQAFVDQQGYYQTNYTTDKGYAETRFELSPLNRPLEQGAPGDSWQIGQRTMKYAYDVADSAEVIKWKFETMLSSPKAVYDLGELYENTTFDEDSSQTVEYKDKRGQTILKKSQVDATTWAETYYIYDIYGQLAAVLPPEATAELDSGFFKSGADRGAFLNTWAFLYDYDGRNRMIMKKVPGADSVFMVYDRWDRLVLTQDGNQRCCHPEALEGQTAWLFTKYDALNRPVMTGIAIMAGTIDAIRDSVEASTQRAESFSAMGVNEYTDVTFPPNDSVDNYLTVTYYENYDWDTTGLSYTNPTGLTLNTAVKGQVTGTLTKTGSGGWIKSVSYYDDRYQVIQTQSTNHLGGTDIVTNYYDFIGQVTKSVSAHNNGAITRTTTRRFTYDHAGRLLNTWHELSEEVQWTDLVGVTANGNELTKTAAQAWDNGGAASIQQIPEGSDGAVQMAMIGTGHEQMLGFSQTNDGPGYTTIDFAIYPTKGRIYVYEDGVSRGQVGTYVSGDVLKVKRTGTTITYLKNDTIVYTSSISSTGSIIADVSIYHANEKMHDVRISFEEVQIASNSYNELGELITKSLHSGEQVLDYTYNIRGWLTSINDPNLTGNDLFGMELFYDVQDGSLNNSQLYNGNISAMRWSDPTGANSSLAYNYSYDKLNRLETADHFMGATDTASYDVQGLNYDLNGNIEGLQRRAKSTTTFMDSLAYEYVGNQLRSVSDAQTDTTDTGFYDGFTANVDTADYEYDANGNMVKDRNKGIDSIYYNHLNLPVKVVKSPLVGGMGGVSGDSITYLYDAAGIKLQQKVFSGGALAKTTDYVGEFIYEDGVLQLIQHEEGRIVEKGNDYIVYENDASSVSAFASYLNVTKTTEAINGETYVKVVSNQATGYPGVWPIGGYIAVEEGREYTLRIKGYTETSHQTGIWVKGNSTIIWPGPSLPNGSANEGWIETSFTVPTGVTQIQVGVEWLENPSVGETFLINSLELRAESNRNTYDYQYHLKDHLGNVRLTFSTTPENYTMLATMEYSDEAANFENYVPYEDLSGNETNSGTHVSRNSNLLNNGLDLNTFLCVNKGDTIKTSAYAYYNDSGSSYDLVTSVIASTLFTDAFNPNKVAEGVSAASANFDAAFAAGTPMGGRSQTTTAPLAFINYIFFDADMNYKHAGFKQITTASNGASVQVVADDFIPDQDGYVLVYLSNETDGSQLIVSWDDFEVYHGKTNVVSTQDYYPFGLTFNESVRVASTPNRFKYNSFEFVEDFNLNLYDYQARYYDPAIGRFIQVDPAADLMRRHSPYNYAFDNPIRYIDPDGMVAFDVTINGDMAEEATAQLNESSDLEITRDSETGKLSATGKATTKADKALLAAINDENITVNVNATSSNTTNVSGTEKDLLLGAFGGSIVNEDGTITAQTDVNPNQAKVYEDVYQTEAGLVITHEILESYSAAVESPGTSPPTMMDVIRKTESGKNYSKAHKTAMKQDQRFVEPTIIYDISSGTGTYYLQQMREIPGLLDPFPFEKELFKKKN